MGYATFDEVKEHLRSGIAHIDGYEIDTKEIHFYCNDGYVVTFYHDQDCCETVKLESADGLVNHTDIYTGCKWCNVVMAQEKGRGEYDTSATWTFYIFTTDKGYDTMRWYGESNGYYSEEVDYAVSTWGDDPNSTNLQLAKDGANALFRFCRGFPSCASCPFRENEDGKCGVGEPYDWNPSYL